MAILIEDPCDLAKPPPAEKVTYEQFLEWLDENTFGEWVDGEVVPMSAASAQHQDVSGFLAALLRLYAEERTSGMVLAAPFQMRLSRIRRGRAPDLMFIAKEHLTQLKPSFLDGPADCVIEVASPDSALNDRGTKYAEYEAGGVREYWCWTPRRSGPTSSCWTRRSATSGPRRTPKAATTAPPCRASGSTSAGSGAPSCRRFGRY